MSRVKSIHGVTLSPMQINCLSDGDLRWHGQVGTKRLKIHNCVSFRAHIPDFGVTKHQISLSRRTMSEAKLVTSCRFDVGALEARARVDLRVCRLVHIAFFFWGANLCRSCGQRTCALVGTSLGWQTPHHDRDSPCRRARSADEPAEHDRTRTEWLRTNGGLDRRSVLADRVLDGFTFATFTCILDAYICALEMDCGRAFRRRPPRTPQTRTSVLESASCVVPIRLFTVDSLCFNAATFSA